jgi:hypothetical protein
MRGEVEIWNGEQLLYVEPNMIVDGAGELLADIMTVSPSLSSVNHLGTSSILDASNYRIQAISFGTGKDAFNENARKFSIAKNTRYKNDFKYDLNFYGAGNILAISGIVPIVFAVSSLPNPDPQFTMEPTALSYAPRVGLPIAPEPILTELEPGIQSSQTVGDYSISSIFPSNGQLTNFIPSAIAFYTTQNTQVSSQLSAITTASIMGSFPPGSSTLPAGSNFHVLYYNIRSESLTNLTPSLGQVLAQKVPVIGGFFNEVSSMDVSGFVNMVMSSVPAGSYQMSSTASGLCISANSNFSSNGVIEYSVSLASGDLAFANAYGGIYHLGLWTIDINKSLQNGNTPPYSFNVLNNPRKYKLFCRKGLSKNLCYTTDEKFRNDLTIKWRLHFL